MKKITVVATALGVLFALPLSVEASPKDDLKAFQGYFKTRFPNTKFDDFSNGVYSIDKASREQWEEIEEFPPYELAIEEGQEIWNKKFKNGKTFKSCLGGEKNLAAKYPHFDKKRKEVVTLPVAINECLEKNGESPLGYKKGKMAALLSFLAYNSRGQKIDVEVKGKDAEEAYEAGKQFFYARRGQLNFSCAHCHVDNAGNKIRADILSPALGHVTHFPVYRSKWGEMGTLHRRFDGCNKQVQAIAHIGQGVPQPGVLHDLYEQWPGVERPRRS